MIGSGFVTSKECKCWSTISSVSTTPNRWPERKVGDRGETRLADISPCMFMGKKTRGGKILRTREEHGDDVDGGRQVLSAVGEELPGVSLIYILIYINLQIYHWICLQSSRSAWGNIVYGHTAYGIRHFQFPRRRSPVAVAATPSARPFSLFSILPARLRPSSSGQWINSSGPIGLVLSASTHAIPLFSLFLHWPRTCMYFLHSRMVILKSTSNTKLLI